MYLRHVGIFVLTLLSTAYLGPGCTSGAGGGGGKAAGGDSATGADLTVDVVLNETARTFEVSPGEPVQHTDIVSLALSGQTVTSGSISIDPAAISLIPATSAKTTSALQAGSMDISVTVWIGSLDLDELTCDLGDRYGPFTITLDESGAATEVRPPSVPLTGNTIGLLPDFFVCIQVDVFDVIEASIDFASLRLNLETLATGGGGASDGSGGFGGGTGRACQSPGDCEPLGCCTCQRGVCVDSRDD